MRTKDIEVGLRVLAGRPNSRSNLRVGTVVKTGVTHSYYASGGYTSYGGYSTKDNGVLVKLDRPLDSEPDGTVFRPEHLQLASGKVYDLWLEQERRRAEDEAAEERQRAADQELLDGFAKLGYTGLGVTRDHLLTMTRTEAGRILATLEQHAGERARPGPTCPHGNISRVTCNECS